jgi:hypothetical protein
MAQYRLISHFDGMPDAAKPTARCASNGRFHAVLSGIAAKM